MDPDPEKWYGSLKYTLFSALFILSRSIELGHVFLLYCLGYSVEWTCTKAGQMQYKSSIVLYRPQIAMYSPITNSKIFYACISGSTIYPLPPRHATLMSKNVWSLCVHYSISYILNILCLKVLSLNRVVWTSARLTVESALKEIQV